MNNNDADVISATCILSDATVLAGTALASLQLVECETNRDFESYHEQCISMMIDLISKIAKASKKIQEEHHEYDKGFIKYKKTVEMLRTLRNDNIELRRRIQDMEEKCKRDNNEPLEKIAELTQSLISYQLDLESLKSASSEHQHEKEVRIDVCCPQRFF